MTSLLLLVLVQSATVVHAFADGLPGVRAANADVRLSVARDPALPDQQVLVVEHPAPTANPAGRDVQSAAAHQDWSAGRAIEFQVKPDHAGGAPRRQRREVHRPRAAGQVFGTPGDHPAGIVEIGELDPDQGSAHR